MQQNISCIQYFSYRVSYIERYVYFLMIVSCEDNQPTTTGLDLANGATGWELALVTAPSSNESAVASSKLVSFCNYFQFLLFSVCIEFCY